MSIKKQPINRVNRSMKWEKIFAKCMFSKVLISRVVNNSYNNKKLVLKTENNFVKKIYK